MAEQQGITKITVQGFKSLYDESPPIDIRPLTLLAGANSSGKSSIMQSLLLMKQTLEAKYYPDVFSLDGPNVRFTNDLQFLSESMKMEDNDESLIYRLEVSYNFDNSSFVSMSYLKLISKNNPDGFILATQMKLETDDINRNLRFNMSHDEIISNLDPEIDQLRTATKNISQQELRWRIIPDRCFLSLALFSENDTLIMTLRDFQLKTFPVGRIKQLIQEVIHIPGLRGNPQRAYPVTAVNFDRFEGTFEPYTASVIHHWQRSEKDEDKERLARLSEQMKELGLAPYIAAQFLNDAQIEVRVGRSIQSSEEDTVSIADVGFGVSQVLPVLVALLVAKTGQLVYIEQPELHLHPRAQVKLAQILADAANRGVRVVVETHSSLLLLGLQTLIAEGKLEPEKTILHWFTRNEEGKTKIDSQVPDDNGAYGNWPEDFADTELDIQSKYLNAVANRQEQVGAE